MRFCVPGRGAILWSEGSLYIIWEVIRNVRLLGNTEAVVPASGGILPDIHANPGRQLSWVGKTLHVADFGNHGQGKEILDAFVADQGLYGLFILCCSRQYFKPLVVAGLEYVCTIPFADPTAFGGNGIDPGLVPAPVGVSMPK